ncbi:MAG: sarcosine oxidase subunit gamma [Pseudomonadota bacterium]
MVRLIARSAAQDLLPIEGPGVRVEEAAFAPLTSLAGDIGGALKAAHGLDLPAPGQVASDGVRHCLWFGRAHWMLIGVEGDAPFAGTVTDQSDAWCRVVMSGARAAEALSYLTPIDLRDGAFPVGVLARTQIKHLNASIWRREAKVYELMAFRSMAVTLVHDLKEAMRSLP